MSIMVQDDKGQQNQNGWKKNDGKGTEKSNGDWKGGGGGRQRRTMIPMEEVAMGAGKLQIGTVMNGKTKTGTKTDGKTGTRATGVTGMKRSLKRRGRTRAQNALSRDSDTVENEYEMKESCSYL